MVLERSEEYDTDYPAMTADLAARLKQAIKINMGFTEIPRPENVKKRPYNTMDFSSKLPSTRIFIMSWRRNYPSLDTLGQVLILGQEYNLPEEQMSDLRTTVCEIVASCLESGNPLQTGYREQQIQHINKSLAGVLLQISPSRVDQIMKIMNLSGKLSMEDLKEVQDYRNNHRVGRPKLK